MVDAVIDEDLVVDAGGFQRRLVVLDAGVDAFVEAGIVQHQRSLDFRHVLRRRLPSVEGHGGREFGNGHRGCVADAATIAEADDANPAGRAFMRHQEIDGGEEIVHQLHRVDGLLQLAALVVVAGIAADACQPVGGQREVASLAKPPRDILDIGVEAAILVHDDHCGQLAGGGGGAGEQSVHVAMTLRRGIGDPLGSDRGIVGRHLLGERIIGAHLAQDRGGGQAAHGIFPGAVEKFALGDLAMRVEVIELEQFRGEVPGGQSGHGLPPVMEGKSLA